MRAEVVGKLVAELRVDGGEVVAPAAVFLEVAQVLDAGAVHLRGLGGAAAGQLGGEALGEVGQPLLKDILSFVRNFSRC